jgi:alkyl sulfatase BDS1-like metallo-beta-lactamase superfamily hydrolase
MTAEQIFDSMGVRFDPEAFGDPDGTSSLVVDVTFTDLDERHVLGVRHAALHQRPHQHAPDADAALTCSRGALADVLGRVATLDDQIDAGAIDVSGDVDALRRLFDSLTVFTTQRLIEPQMPATTGD